MKNTPQAVNASATSVFTARTEDLRGSSCQGCASGAHRVARRRTRAGASAMSPQRRGRPLRARPHQPGRGIGHRPRLAGYRDPQPTVPGGIGDTPLKKARAALQLILTKAAKFGGNGKLSSECAGAIGNAITEVQQTVPSA